jgi:hypothetical protein
MVTMMQQNGLDRQPAGHAPIRDELIEFERYLKSGSGCAFADRHFR